MSQATSSTGHKATLDERVSARVSCFMKQQFSQAAGLRVPSSVRQREDMIESSLRGVERKTTYATLHDRAFREVRQEMAAEAKLEARIAARRKESALKARPAAATPSASASKRARSTVAMGPQLSTSKRSRVGAGKASTMDSSATEVGHY